MVEILQEIEGVPSSYPTSPTDLSSEAKDLDSRALWKRIESFVSYRWSERTATWIVQGPGWWQPRLSPFTLDSAEVWNGETWESVTLSPAPIGYELAASIYKVSGTVGTTSVPSDVLEAFRRLAEYLADDSYIGRVASSGSRDLGDVSISSKRPVDWQGKALHYSGAADLLRRYR
jgi:hypothetical protein